MCRSKLEWLYFLVFMRPYSMLSRALMSTRVSKIDRRSVGGEAGVGGGVVVKVRSF